METQSEYIPGVCNIGRSEIKARRNFAIYAVSFSLILIALLLMLHTGKIWRLTLFIPAASTGVGFQQWYFHFCANFGLRGVLNFGKIGKTFTVDQKENFKRDRIKAWKIIISGILFGIIITAVFYILPL